MSQTQGCYETGCDKSPLRPAGTQAFAPAAPWGKARYTCGRLTPTPLAAHRTTEGFDYSCLDRETRAQIQQCTADEVGSIARRKRRIQNDFYETAEGLTLALLNRCPELKTALILEPCAGDGAIARFFPDCVTNDVDPTRSCDYALDAADPCTWDEFDEVDWVVTNPPFSKAAQILPLALDHALDGVAFLLRLTYLEPCSDRAAWLLEHADQMRFCLPCNPRPQFRQDTGSTDSTTVAWFVWSKYWSWTEHGISPPIQFITGWR